MSRVPVIGLIGAIGAGKSAAAKLLTGLGGDVVDCDALGHAAINRPEVLAELVRRWGPAVANADGSANRRAVAGIVFRKPEELKYLEGLLFPIIGGMAFERIRECKAAFLVLDAAMLIEADWRRMCDRVAFINAPRDLRVQRVANRGWSDHDLAEREVSQLPNDEKKARADAVLMNDGTLDEMRTKIETLLKQWNIG